MRQQTINELLDLAYNAYTSNEPADNYARNAACKSASDAAKRHSEECSDSAALLAAHGFLKSTSDATHFAARLADSANLKFAHERNHKAAQTSFTKHRAPLRTIIDSSYADIVNDTENSVTASSDQINAHYQTTYSRDPTANQKATHAASYVYSHTYSTARSAYVLASFQANKTQDPHQREQIFKSYLSERLNHDLTYDLIKPSLFLQMMCSTTLCVIAGILMIGGVAAILCATYGVASIPFAVGIAAGSLSAATGSGLLIGSFFAKRELQKIEDANERVEETNAIF